MPQKPRTTMTKKLVQQIDTNIKLGEPLKEISTLLMVSYVTVRRVAKKILEYENYANNFICAYNNSSPATKN